MLLLRSCMCTGAAVRHERLPASCHCSAGQPAGGHDPMAGTFGWQAGSLQPASYCTVLNRTGGMDMSRQRRHVHHDHSGIARQETSPAARCGVGALLASCRPTLLLHQCQDNMSPCCAVQHASTGASCHRHDESSARQSAHLWSSLPLLPLPRSGAHGVVPPWKCCWCRVWGLR
jgi:hypothetical protein